MRKVTGNMTTVVRQMDRAMESMNLEKVSLSLPIIPYGISVFTEIDQISMVMEKFETQFEDMNVQTAYMEGAMGDSAAVSTPQDQVDSLMSQVADEAGIEREHELGQTEKVPELETTPVKEAVEEDALAKRLRALRPQAS